MDNFYKFASDSPFLTIFMVWALTGMIVEVFKAIAGIFKRR